MPARQAEVVVQRRGAQSADRPRRLRPALLELTGDDAQFAATRERDRRNLARGNVAIGRRLHLFARRQVDPQLEPAHAACGLLRHLGMNDAARRRHPLHVTGAEVAPIAEAVLVTHVPVEHVGDGLEPAMRMRGETRQVVVRVVGEELVEHQERIESLVLATAEAAAQLDAGAVGGGHGLDHGLQLARSGHGCSCRVAEFRRIRRIDFMSACRGRLARSGVHAAHRATSRPRRVQPGTGTRPQPPRSSAA